MARGAAAGVAVSAWQPIETAPKCAGFDTGHQALLYSPSVGIHTGHIGSHTFGLVGSISGFHGCAIRDWGVTHWMPLPDPPAKEER